MRYRGLIRVIGVMGALTAPLFSQIEVNATVDRSEITIGDKILYKIEVHFPVAGTVELPSALGNLGQFEVKDYSQGQPVESKEGQSQTWRFTLSTFTVGEYIIPPQTVEFTPENDTAKQILHTEPIKINVLRTSAETEKDIADITGLAALNPGSRVGLILTILVILLLAGGIVFWLYKAGKPAERAKPALPPFEEAMELLSKLYGENLVGQDRAKEYCFRLSEILRAYISRRFSIDALESTTEEFLEKVRNIDITESNRDSLSAFCERTDPVKFADVPLSVEEGNRLHQQVKEFIHLTKPRVEEPPAGARHPVPLRGGAFDGEEKQ